MSVCMTYLTFLVIKLIMYCIVIDDIDDFSRAGGQAASVMVHEEGSCLVTLALSSTSSLKRLTRWADQSTWSSSLHRTIFYILIICNTKQHLCSIYVGLRDLPNAWLGDLPNAVLCVTGCCGRWEHCSWDQTPLDWVRVCWRSWSSMKHTSKGWKLNLLLLLPSCRQLWLR